MSGVDGSQTTYPRFVLGPPPTNPQMTDSTEPEQQPGADGLFSEPPSSCTIHVLSSKSGETELTYTSLEDVIATAQALFNKTLNAKQEFEAIKKSYKHYHELPQNESLLETTSRELSKQLVALKATKKDFIGERDKVVRQFTKRFEILQHPLRADEMRTYNNLMRLVHKNLRFFEDVDATEVRIRNKLSLNIPLASYKCGSYACCLLKFFCVDIPCCICDERCTLSDRHMTWHKERYGSNCCEGVILC